MRDDKFDPDVLKATSVEFHTKVISLGNGVIAAVLIEMGFVFNGLTNNSNLKASHRLISSFFGTSLAIMLLTICPLILSVWGSSETKNKRAFAIASLVMSLGALIIQSFLLYLLVLKISN